MNWKDLTGLPPKKLLAGGVVAGAVLVAVLVGGFTASGSPKVCGACHSMDLAYSRWLDSNHKQFSCVDCHLPDTNLAGQVVFKIKSGLNDLFHETLKTYSNTMVLTPEDREVANGNCLRCHFSTVQFTPMGAGGADCLKCHRFLVHQRGLEKGGGIILGQQ